MSALVSRARFRVLRHLNTRPLSRSQRAL